MSAELDSVLFICAKCHAPTHSWTYMSSGRNVYTGVYGFHYQVRCHGSSWNYTVRAKDLGTPEHPFAVQVFTEPEHETKKMGNRPNVRFHCDACDQMTDDFIVQFDEQKRSFAFVVNCQGHQCNGKRHVAVFKEKDLFDRNVWLSPVPYVLPMRALLLSHTSKQNVPPLQFVSLKPVMRKLKLE